MKVSLQLPPDLQRLPVPVETALFRILQESLTNVHRHANSPTVDVELTLEQSAVRLSVRDYGKGIPETTLERFRKNGTNVGVGLAGIRERIKELSGKLDIESNQSGTTLTVLIPIADNKATQPGLPRARAGVSAIN